MAASQFSDNTHNDASAQIPPGRYRDDPDEDDELDEEALLPSNGLGPVHLDDSDLHSKPSFKDRVTERIPPRLVRVWRAVRSWVVGPKPPRIYKINDFLPVVQHAPLKLMDRYAPKRIHRVGLLFAFWVTWLLCFSLILWKSSFASEIRGYGSPVRLWCGARFWDDRNECGINGDLCRPFANSSVAFRCPANCAKQLIFHPHPVGDQETIYKTLVVGGASDQSQPVESSVYRGDSFICPAAIHAGFVNDDHGGCGVLELVGEQENYPSTNSHHITSFGFDSYFPQSFRFVPGTSQQCKDLRWPILIISVIMTCLLSVFTTSTTAFFWSNFVILFATTALATDPPNRADYASLISLAAEHFLPACFCMAVMYWFPVRRQLNNLTAQFEKTVLWLGGAWVGALNNYTFAAIPVRRLTLHDIQTQPGAVPSVIIVVLSIFGIALGQAWCFRVEGRMPRYLRLYILLCGSLLLLLAVPKVTLRVHHYILALLLLPGTALQTRPSVLYQGLLVGLFVNGVARWGFASIIETPAALFDGDDIGSLIPAVAAPVANALGDAITFTFGPLPDAPDKRGRVYDGISVLVNDVERLRSYADYLGRGQWVNSTKTWSWSRHKEGLPEYFRFAYMMGKTAADYSRAAIWHVNGTWSAAPAPK